MALGDLRLTIMTVGQRGTPKRGWDVPERITRDAALYAVLFPRDRLGDDADRDPRLLAGPAVASRGQGRAGPNTAPQEQLVGHIDCFLPGTSSLLILSDVTP